MSLSKQEKETIGNRRRVWEARKYCQVQPSLAHFARDGEAPSGRLSGQNMSSDQPDPDPALAALLRGVLHQLPADLAMLSLLDDHTQYFISGATDSNYNDAEITLQSTQWYSCDRVTHHGGLCERTITLEQKSGNPIALYEELDMSSNERTKDLPFVNGSIASFRHYVGIPIATAEGYNIGTVFTMSREASATGISSTQRRYLHEASKQVMCQLVQAMQALEGRRAARYNAAVASLLNGQAYDEIEEIHRHHSGTAQPEVATSVYSVASKLLHEYFEFSGLVFQDVPLSRQESSSSTNNSHDHILASSLRPGMAAVLPLGLDKVDRLLEMFPQGGVLHEHEQDDEKSFIGTASDDLRSIDRRINEALDASFPGARQIVFAPLWDAMHCRTTAICFGWVREDGRIYSPGTDLTALLSFCMAAMSHIQRLEAQHLDQVKSDFLGSISHETRSPLHNVLGNLELLLGTECDDEQREMLVNARFGATQLLETIDKILQYSRISNQSTAAPELLKAHGPDTQGIDNLHPFHEDDQDRDKILQVGQRPDDEGGTASGATDLIGLCEEIVEDVAKRMRLSDTIMSTKSKERTMSVSQGSPRGSPQPTSDGEDGKGYFSVVLLDARSIDNCQVSSNSGLRIILENLLSNAMKFTRIDCCIRCSLTLTSDYAVLSVTDCGRGFSQDFVRHSLYVPFSQQNFIDDGMGLGMSLIKRHVEELKGTLQIDTEQSLGTSAIVHLPVQQLTHGIEQNPENDPQGRGGTALIPPLPSREENDLPVLKTCVYVPSSWMRRFDERDKRSIDLLRGSLKHTLGAWFQPAISIWQEVEDVEDQELPDLIFVTQNDVEVFRQTASEKFKDVKTIVFCADIGNDIKADHSKIKAASTIADAIITGSVIPSKLWKTITVFFPHVVPAHGDTIERSYQDLGIQGPDGPQSGTGEEQNDQKTTQDDAPKQFQNATTDTRPTSSEKETTAPRKQPQEKNESSSQRVPHGQLEMTARPRILLVDDNSVNLKMLAMFLKKSGIPPSDQKAVTGGQEAIDAFEEAIQTGDDESRYDIIFMDLSMPEVSGFDATAAIRRIEVSQTSKRAFIVALSGLVSDKDRSAAANAGVDDYVTKPAGLKNVQAIIRAWASA